MNNKKLIAILTLLCFMFTLMPVAVFAEDSSIPVVNGNWIDAADTSWYDASKTEFTITTAEQLAGLAKLVNSTVAIYDEAGKNITGYSPDYRFSGKTIKLGADIDLAGKNWTPIGTSTNAFWGEFDGNNKTISNLTIADNTITYAGLFGQLQGISTKSDTTYAKVHKLNLSNVFISAAGATESATTYAGALVGYLNKGTYVSDVTISGVSITTTATEKGFCYAGGLCGRAYTAMISGVSVSTVSLNHSSAGTAFLGGVVGRATGHNSYWTAEDTNTKFLNCKANSVAITVNASGTVYTGGFLGACGSYSGSTNRYQNCDISKLSMDLSGNAAYYAGGFMGHQNGLGEDSYCTASGTIMHTGTNDASVFGGFVGYQGGRGRTHANHTVDVDIVATVGTVGGFTGKMQQYTTQAYTYSNCTVNGDVSTKNGIAGGFIGKLTDFDSSKGIYVTLDNCSVNNTVIGTTYASGLWGYVEIGGRATDNIVIKKNCTSATSVTGAVTNTIINLPKEYAVSTSSDSDKYVIGDAVAYVTKIVDEETYDIGYATLAEAAAAGTDKVTLLQDVTEDFTLERTATTTEGGTTVYPSFTLDMNDYDYIGVITVIDHIGSLTFENSDADSNIQLAAPEGGHDVFNGWCNGNDPNSPTYATTSSALGYVTWIVTDDTWHTHWTPSGYEHIDATARHFDFGTENYGYSVPAAKEVTFVYHGNDSADAKIKDITKPAYFDASYNGLTASVKPKENLPVGTYVETIYVTTHDGSSHSITAMLEVEELDTTVTAAANNTTATYGDNITLTATVTVDGNADVAGDVEFYCGNTLLGKADVVNGAATINYDTAKQGLNIGANTITAEYSGSAILNEGSSEINVTVTKAQPAVTLTASETSFEGAKDITLTANVTGLVGTDSAAVTLTGIDGVAPVEITGNGAATFTVSIPADAKTYNITATVNAGEYYETADAAATVTVYTKAEDGSITVGGVTVAPSEGESAAPVTPDINGDVTIGSGSSVAAGGEAATVPDNVTVTVPVDKLEQIEIGSNNIVLPEDSTVTVGGKDFTVETGNVTVNADGSVTIPSGTELTQNGTTQSYPYGGTITADGTVKANPKPSTSTGGGFSGTYNYPVSVPTADNGKVTLSDSNASAGETVTITVTPNNGYGAADVIVTDEKGNVIPVTNLGGGKYSFVMSAGKVSVTAEFKPAITLTVGSKTANVFGKTVINDVAPVIVDGRTMLPIRFVAEALGADVSWNADTQTVTITKDDTVIKIIIGADYAYINGEKVSLDAPAFIDNSRTYLPVRFVSEALGADVTWDAVTRQVVIMK